MDNQELRRGLDELRSKLDIIEGEMALGEPPPEAVRDVERALSGVRTDLWTLLTAKHSDDYVGYLGMVRVRRATETCEDVLADLHAEALPTDMPGLEVFHATLRELSRMCKQTRSQTLQLEGVHDE